MDNLIPALLTHLKQGLPEYKTIRRWNNDFVKADAAAQYDFPCLFIGFPSVNWSKGGYGVRFGTYTMRLYLGLIDFDVETMMDITEKKRIEVLLNNFSYPGATPFELVAEEEDSDDSQVCTRTMDFVFTFQSDTIRQDAGYIEVTLTPDITAEVDIDNSQVRTGDGQD